MRTLTSAVMAFTLVVAAGCRSTDARRASDAGRPESGGRVSVDLSGPGWSLWRDRDAKWQDEALFAPPVDLGRVPANAPTGGWSQLNPATAAPVSVPGTVEANAFELAGRPATRPTALYAPFRGVSWWFRNVHVPEAARGRRVVLRFEAVRLRAEVFVDGKLVGYDLVGDSAFEVDLTGRVTPGQDAQLAVRVTNPGGNYGWEDFSQIQWGEYALPTGHAFGGITGDVTLLALDPVHVDDVYVQNQPEVTAVNVQATVTNTTGQEQVRDVGIAVREQSAADGPSPRETFRKSIRSVRLPPGDTVVSCRVEVPDAKVWDLDHPALYECRVRLDEGGDAMPGDVATQTFGFRWFTVDGVGENAVFRLNGKRVFARTAISWGYWPIEPLTPTPALAERQVRLAKSLGLNMLNFHRAIGQPSVLDQADRQGLLYYEEPGSYVGGGRGGFGQALARAKLMRMVKRDRSHPSLVLYNMINEQWDKHGAKTDRMLRDNFQNDLQAAHAIDPSRLITFASAWVTPKSGPNADGQDEQFVKMHARPFDDRVHFYGWSDYHRAGGPETWQQAFYRGPHEHYGRSTNKAEVVYWGEESAMSAPPRLGLIKAELDASRRPGWDGAAHLADYARFDAFLDRYRLRAAFPTVDDLCVAMGNVAFDQQGRKIEDTRVCDANDGYAINGWESEPFDDFSGIVDEFRNPKGDPSVLAYYNQPLYLAVKPRRQIYRPGESASVDLYAINEKDLRGDFTLRSTVADASGKQVATDERRVTLQGGDVYGQLIAEAVAVPLGTAAGMHRIRATLTDANGVERASGRDDVLVVNFKTPAVVGRGAVYEQAGDVGRFLKGELGIDAPRFDGTQQKLDWLIVARPPKITAQPIATGNLTGARGNADGLTATFFRGSAFQERLAERVERKTWFDVDAGAAPDPAVASIDDYAVRWEGGLTDPAGGRFTLSLERAEPDDPARLFVDGQCVIDLWTPGRMSGEAELDLEPGKGRAIRVEYYNKSGPASLHLSWRRPDPSPLDPAAVLHRAVADGTTVILADYADAWIDHLERVANLQSDGRFDVGVSWAGGQYFVKAHPLFDGLPANVGLGWPYQAVVRRGRGRYGLKLAGDELVCGAYQSIGSKLGTAVGVVRCGKGSVVVSTLDICPRLGDPPGPSDVARKLLCNYVRFAAPPGASPGHSQP